MDSQEVKEDAFPARTKTATGTVQGVPTEVTSMSFSDKLVMTISQGGRLSQWMQVPLMASPAGALDPIMHLPPSAGGGLVLPPTHLNPTTVFGAGTPEMEARGRLLATQVAAMAGLRDPDDRRVLVLGLGLGKLAGGDGTAVPVAQEGVLDALELLQRVL